MIKRLLIVLSLLVLPHLVVAQETSSWIGQKVVTKYEYPITSWYLVVPTHGFHVYTVQRTSGDWLWVVSGSVKGWIPARQVVRFDQAIDFYTQEIKANPGNSAAWNLRGLIWNEKKEYDKAITDYNETIRLDPKLALAYNDRGNAWRDKKEYDKAIADFNEAIRLDPKLGFVYFNRGAAWGAKKDYDKAIADCNEAIRVDPRFALAYGNRGNAWSAKKYYEKAIADYNEAIRIDPKYAWGYHALAWLWATCPEESFRDGKRAVELATRACGLAEWKDANMLATLAAAYAEVNEFDKAVEWEEKAIQLYANADDRKKGEDRLKLYKDRKPYRESK